MYIRLLFVVIPYLDIVCKKKEVGRPSRINGIMCMPPVPFVGILNRGRYEVHTTCLLSPRNRLSPPLYCIFLNSRVLIGNKTSNQYNVVLESHAAYPVLLNVLEISTYKPDNLRM